jgi:NAD-dependent deacetylase
VVWFGEALPPAALAAAWEAAQTCQVFFSVGTSSLVEPAASLPWEARRRGALVVEVNPQPTPLSEVATFVLRGPAGTVLPEIAVILARERLARP